MSGKKKTVLCVFSVLAVLIIIAAIFFESIVNGIMNRTMGKDLPKLEGIDETGKWYSVDVEDAVCSDGSRWHGYF